MNHKYIQRIGLIFCLCVLCSVNILSRETNSKSKDPKVFKKHMISPGLVMAGYQGWFDAPDDGAGLGWYHYSINNRFGL